MGQIAFRNPQAAELNLTRVAERVPAGVAAALTPLLQESPDPDGALNLFERLVEAANNELFRLLDRNRFLIHYAVVVFGHSQFLGDTLVKNRDLFHVFQKDKNLDRIHSREEFRETFARFRSRSFETDIALLLARFKRREYVRIMLRDVLGIATLAETTAEISALSDVLVEEALRETEAALHGRYGAPQHVDREGRLTVTAFAVLALGKLGGNELNYSSDVDLLYIYGDGSEPPDAAVSNREYFVRLAQELTGTLGRVTREGPVFRIDLRLRPQGGEGEAAVGLSVALRYYAETAHDWEKQALIKLRHSAGDVLLAREFIRGVQPHIYSEQLNFAAIETAVKSREKMGFRRRHGMMTRRAAEPVDIKLNRGGIRDIEFLVQCLQRVYGGAEPWLRSGGTLFSLQKLHDKGHITGKDFHILTTSYEFLRCLEHRLQLRHGQQTHKLPQSEAELRVLYRSMPAEATSGYQAGALANELRQRMKAVADIYDRIIHQQQAQQYERIDAEFRLSGSAAEAGREQSHQHILERLAEDSPDLYEIARRSDLSGQARRNLYRFLSAAFTSSERYAAVLEATGAVERALELFAASDYLTEILIRHPQEIATIATISESGPAERPAPMFDSGAPGNISNDPVFAYLVTTPAEYPEKLALLRQQYRHRVFASGTRDLLDVRPVYESLTETTAAAEEAINAALAIVGAPPGFAVMGLGRLATFEFDILSDADLIFVRSEDASPEETLKAAERMVQALAAYTRDGTVFAVDPRLRPRGGEGELVITPAALETYFGNEAQVWEALSYTKLRFIAGSREMGERAREAVMRACARFGGDESFPAAVREMRAKLEKLEPGERNFKSGPGGVYDIDFLIGCLCLKHAAPRTSGNLRAQIRDLAERGLLSKADASLLDSAAELMRTLEHVVRLVLGRPRKTMPVAPHARDMTKEVTEKLLHSQFPHVLPEELDRTLVAVREIYERLV